MRIVFVVGHPAHVHLFRNAIRELQTAGHHIDILCVEKETTARLLAHFGLEFTSLGKNNRTLVGKAVGLPLKDLRTARHLSRMRPDLVVSTGSPYAAHAAAALSIPNIAFGDTEIASINTMLSIPFTDAVCTPTCFGKDLGPRHIRYNGYKELAYLHPRWYSPDPRVLDILGLDENIPYIVLRLSSQDSSHDLKNESSASEAEQTLLTYIENLSSRGRVFISSERGLPSALSPYELDLPLHRVHDLLYYATLYIGEGATMASEAGVLGTPWVFVSTQGRGFLRDQQDSYGTGYWETSWARGFARAMELLGQSNIKPRWMAKRQRLLEEKIDLTAFMVRFIEDWPNSYEALRARDGTRLVSSRGSGHAAP